jgi:hypothetical protein
VTLDRPAPASGAEVSFAGNSPAVAVPASQTVLPGERSKEFDILLSPDVASASATITARRLGNQIQQTLEVVPALPYVLRCGPPLPKAEPPSDVMSTLGGHNILCRVRLDGKLPLKSHVYLASTRPDLVKPPEPSSLAVTRTRSPSPCRRLPWRSRQV